MERNEDVAETSGNPLDLHCGGEVRLTCWGIGDPVLTLAVLRGDA
jgi:hypothetical protein